MPSLFKSTKRSHPKPSPGPRKWPTVTPVLSDEDAVPIPGASRSHSRKLLSRFRRSAAASASVGRNANSSRLRSSPSSIYESTSSSSGSTSSPERASLDFAAGAIADIVHDPHLYTTLLLQASAERANGGVKIGGGYSITPSPVHSRGGSASTSNSSSLLQSVPPCTPDSSPPRSKNASSSGEAGAGAGAGSGSDSDALREGVTYDAILASALNRNLGLCEDGSGRGSLEITAPPSSPVNSSPRGGFSSLVAASLAIMEGRAQSSKI